MDHVRRFAGPAVVFFVGAGLQVSGIEDFKLAVVIWIGAVVWGLLALITWPPVAMWLPSMAITWPALQRIRSQRSQEERKVEGPVVEKGFLDFWVDAETAGNELPKLLTRLGRETTHVAKRISNHSGRFERARGNAKKSQQIATDASKDIDRYSTFIEKALPELRGTLRLFAESWIGYLETSPEVRDKTKKGEIEVFQATVQGLQKEVRTSREKIAGFRNAVQGLRQRNASQKLNSATDKLSSRLDEVISVMKELEGAAGRLARLSAKRLEEMR